MKVNTIIGMLLLLAVSNLNASTVSAQSLSEVKVSFGLSDASLQTAFKKIESQTDFRFAFRKEMITTIHGITLSNKTRTVQQLLDEIFKDTGLGYKQLNNSIIIFKKDSKEPETGISFDQITGVVRDENGASIPGVSVKIKGKSNGTVTDASGGFKIEASSNEVLVFSFIGYITIEKPADASQRMEVMLKANIDKLDDVVIVGYGTTTKRNNTGSVSTVTAKDIASQPVSDPLAALEGRVAGLDITSSSGYPGSSYNVHIRGQNSIASGNDPLYIIDGVPFISQSLSQFNGANGAQSPLSSINPSDIEQIDVLKDADATAIYGSRGANGVILITTKKGKAGKPQFTANVYSGVSEINHRVDMLNTQQYIALRQEAYANDNVTPTALQAPDLLTWNQNLDQNWQDKLIGKAAPLTQAELSLRGGSEQTNFLISGTFRNEKIVLPGDLGYKRAGFNFSMNHSSLDKKFQLTVSVKYTADQNNTLPTDITQFFNLPPNYPIYDASGAYYWFGNMQNPMAYFERTSNSQTQNLLGDITASYNIISGLDVKVNAGFNRMNMQQTQTFPEASFNPEYYSGSTANYGSNALSSYIVEPQISYNRNIGKDKLDVLLGGTWQQSVTQGQYLTGSGYSSDELLESVTAASVVTALNNNYVKYRYTSIFGRLTYNWDEKYIINGTFRRDGSSRFGPGKRYGDFGAVGAAWLFSNESFIKDHVGFLSFGKLRGSYGTVGNDQIGDYEYLDTWSSTSFPYGGIPGLYPTRAANPDYSWEVNKKLEAGIDLGFFKDRILLTVNAYRNRSDNQLVGFPLSPQSGFDSFTANLPALVQNKGLEIELTSNNIRNKDFSWNTSFNISWSRNKLLKYPNLENSSYANTFVIGQPISIVKGFAFTGVDPKNGVPQFKDLNGDGSLSDPEDLVIIGNAAPNFFGGMQNNLNYKGFNLSFFFQFVNQHGRGLNYGYLTAPIGTLQNVDVSALNRWKQPGNVTNIPGATASTTSAIYDAYENEYRLSSANWVSTSFIRLKNLSLKYNLAKLINIKGVNDFSVYVQGQNLFTITKYKGFDPETQGYALPPLSIYTAGLQVTF